MSTNSLQINVGGLPVEVVRKQIKNLHIGVYPPNGRVRVAAPVTVSDEAVRLAIVTRMGWIRKQKAKFEAQQRQSEREYVSGETHFFLGRRYRLNLFEGQGQTQVQVRNGKSIALFVPKGSDQPFRQRVFLKWYRGELRERSTPLVEKWAKLMQLGTPSCGIKRMKTKWGSCNAEAGRIWLNLELIKKPPECLEYIIVHELLHFFERKHNERFVELMDNQLPKWRLARDELNAEPLAHDEWQY